MPSVAAAPHETIGTPRPPRTRLSLWIYTMNRCHTIPVSRRLALMLAGLGLCTLALAQNAPRNFPANALRGTLVVTQPPVITMDGKSAQLSPGARIKGPNNLLVMSGAIVGQQILVNYTVEAHGMVHDVWILTEAEAAEKRKRAGQ
jgi:hypothetical protein